MTTDELDKKYRDKYLKALATIKLPGKIEDKCSKEEFEWRIREIAKCKRDIVYFAENWFKIVNLDKGLMTIKLYPKQKELLKFFVNERRCITLASRQSGKTTIYTIYLLWLTQFFPEKQVMVLANKADTALQIISRIITAWEYLPIFLKTTALTFNKGELKFANMSAIKGFATAADAARSYSCNCVVVDEAAFIPNNIASKVFESVFPTISSSKSSRFIMVSTPNGADPKNLYYNLWQQANSKSKESNKQGWKPFRYDWFDVPERDQEWKEATIAAIGAQRFAQEFGNEFLASSTVKKLIPEDIIEKHRIKLAEVKALDKDFAYGKKQRIFNESQDKIYEFTMWHEFDPKKTYLGSGDCAEGIGSDSSVLYIWDVTDLSKITMCAKFSSNQVSPVEFAFVTQKILALYNNPFYICERNGVGSGYLDSLKITYQYANIVKEGKGGEAGVFSHVLTKEKACLWAREMMTTAGFDWTIYDKDLLEDFEAFTKKENKGVHQIYQALPPAHDDHVMAWIWACWVLQPDLVERYFVCCETFTSQLEKIYPRLLQPLNNYTAEQVKTVSKDPLHQQFLDFKDEIQHKLGKAIFEEQQEAKNDVFQRMSQKIDKYFGDFDNFDSWNAGNASQKHGQGLSHEPMFFLP